jgi:hypothetical protein
MSREASLYTERLGIRKYGKVIFTKRPYAPNHLYVIGQVHDHPLEERKLDYEVISTQTDIYRISEQLFKKHDVDLLLAEGLPCDFGGWDSYRQQIKDDASLKEVFKRFSEADDDIIAAFLGSNPIGTNSALLLAAVYDINLRGFEEMELNSTVLGLLGARKGNIKREDIEEYRQSEPEIFKFTFLYLETHLNRLRSGKALINSLDITEGEYQKGHASNRKAMVHIGEAHIADMIDFVKKDRSRVKLNPRIKGHVPSSARIPEMDTKLNLVDRDYGVTFIIPANCPVTKGEKYYMNLMNAILVKTIPFSGDKAALKR